jgi:hypothetical protein
MERYSMDEIKLSYPPELLRKWKLGLLHRDWYRRHRDTFCERDLSNAEGQCHNGYHFGEWYTVRHFRQQGYQVLPPKYLHSTRPVARRKATEILGKAGVRFLERMRKLGGSKLRNPPRPDLLVFRSNPKTFFFVEVKRDKDKLSTAQRQFFPLIEIQFGCEVRIVYLKPRSARRN